MREEKQFLLDDLQEQIEQSNAFVLMSYEGFSSNGMNEFRSEVARQGGHVEVVKKRILQKAAGKAGIPLESLPLQGHIGVVFIGEDPIEMTKFVYKFGKEKANLIQVVGGYVDKELYDQSAIKQLSELPSKQELRAQFVGVLQAPMAETVRAMDAILTSILHAIENKCKKEAS